jgi:MerR family mercuric resistance operon transcriptional regulator
MVAHLLEFGDSRHCAETRDLAAEKLEAIERKIADLEAMRRALTGLVAACGKRSGKRGCPIIESLERA